MFHIRMPLCARERERERESESESRSERASERAGERESGEPCVRVCA